MAHTKFVVIMSSFAEIQPQSHFGTMTKICSGAVRKRFCLSTRNPYFLSAQSEDDLTRFW